MGVAVDNNVWSAAAGIPQNRSWNSFHEARGTPFPIGATVMQDGVNFSVFSRGAFHIDLLLFDREDDAAPARVIPIDPDTGRT